MERIIEGAFADYVIDQNTMFRYARRKGAEQRARQMLEDYRR